MTAGLACEDEVMAEDSEATRTTQGLALYRKYRPATFAEVRGQDHVTEPLRQALRSGRINHAYLFSGPRGCGKTSSARILARSLNCVNGPTPDPCGVCDSCVALAPSGPGSIDVIEIDAASHGGVDDAALGRAAPRVSRPVPGDGPLRSIAEDSPSWPMAHAWKACWGQPLASSNLASSARW